MDWGEKARGCVWDALKGRDEYAVDLHDHLTAEFAQALRDAYAQGWMAGNAAVNPSQKIFDHKYLSSECVERGCQYLCLKDQP